MADLADPIGGEHHRSIGGPIQYAQQRLGQHERSVEVDLQDPIPEFDVEIGDRRQPLEQSRIVQQPVQAAELGFQHLRQIGEVLGGSPFQIHRVDGRLGGTRLFELVVSLLQLADGAPEQDHGGAVHAQPAGGGAADAVSGAGHQNDPVFQQVGGGLVILHGKCIRQG